MPRRQTDRILRPERNLTIKMQKTAFPCGQPASRERSFYRAREPGLQKNNKCPQCPAEGQMAPLGTHNKAAWERPTMVFCHCAGEYLSPRTIILRRALYLDGALLPKILSARSTLVRGIRLLLARTTETDWEHSFAPDFGFSAAALEVCGEPGVAVIFEWQPVKKAGSVISRRLPRISAWHTRFRRCRARRKDPECCAA